MPNVSVIMGIYNCAQTLSNCIESLLEQSYTDWELIMCEDCSYDNTFAIAQSYATKYSNIQVFKNKENKGLAYSLNECLKVAKGKYIARMDGDDLCLPQRFQKQVDFLETNTEFHVVGSSVVLYDENGYKGIRKMIEKPSIYDLAKTVPHIHPTIMMRKVAYDALNGYIVSPRTRRGQDADLWFRFYAKGFRGYNFQEPLCKYHESLSDYKKRSIKVALYGMQTRYIGFKILRLPIPCYIYIFKSLISALLPNKIRYFYHKQIKG
ncbi:glycosyltransferase [Halobacillus halophilus]|uniref:glycosyltransferase n=1 Tax=Halobacillus halophilus TaxID=1570 RepID=UPI00136A5783|nr:glycosyltransferase [Halobacillus halophilus]MYL30777.1 glycosyltransferase [Halobacillus halophilus]